jgi:hypothetical protein
MQRPMTSVPAQSFGLHFKIFQVEEVSGQVSGVDQFGKQMSLPLLLRGKSLRPVAGDRWIIDQTLGPWTLLAYIDGPVPTITGSRTNDTSSILEQILQLLTSGGLIVDQTTA